MRHEHADHDPLRELLAGEDLDPDDARVARLLDDLQGNILRPHGRDHGVHLFVRFDDRHGAIRWLHEMADRVTTHTEQRRQSSTRREDPHQLFVSLGLTSDGYAALGFTTALMPGDARFRLGMKHRDVRAWLHDPPIESWEEPFRREIHALLIAASDESPDVAGGRIDTFVREATRAIALFGEVVHREDGAVIRHEGGHPVEHFGFADGISQPRFLTGPGAGRAGGRRYGWDDRAPLGLVLAPDPHGEHAHSCGSYFVYRKLEQDVAGFRAAVDRIAEAAGTDRAWVEAQTIGRFRDGTPAATAERPAGWTRRPDNDFTFDHDRSGVRCPYHSHMRKVNPRGDKGHGVAEFQIRLGLFGDLRYALYRTAIARRLIGSWRWLFGDAEEARATQDTLERTRRIARRGIPYGHPDDDVGVGLLFLCAQADIGRQFEFLMNVWTNKHTFARDGTGLDPVIGQGAQPHGQLWRRRWGRRTPAVRASLAGYVTLKGGAYFFAPSVSFLRTVREPGPESAPASDRHGHGHGHGPGSAGHGGAHGAALSEPAGHDSDRGATGHGGADPAGPPDPPGHGHPPDVSDAS